MLVKKTQTTSEHPPKQVNIIQSNVSLSCISAASEEGESCIRRPYLVSMLEGSLEGRKSGRERDREKI